jgi:hypothetical protein
VLGIRVGAETTRAGRAGHLLPRVRTPTFFFFVSRLVLACALLTQLRYKCSVVYDAKAKDNEEQSALMFEQYADEVGLV